MKSLKIIGIALVLTIVLSSCGGSNKNKRDSSYGGDSGVIGSGSSVDQIFQNVKAQAQGNHNCGTRLDAHFNATATSDTTVEVQNSPPVAIPNSPVHDFYIGESNTYDLMVVSKLTNGQFLVSLSMCPTQDGLIHPTKTVISFVSPNGIILDDTTRNHVGVIDSAQLTLLTISGYIGNIQVPTTFYPVNITY